MLKLLRLSAVLATVLTTPVSATLLTLRATANPQWGQTSNPIYLGTLAPGDSSAQDVYIMPATIQIRGELRRYQAYSVFRQEQDSGQGYKYIQTVTYEVANCREGSRGIHKSIPFDTQGRQINVSIKSRLELEAPEPGSVNEKVINFVCSYKQ